MRDAMTGQTELVNRAVPQQPRIGRAVRRMTGRTPFGLHRRMFVCEWTLLIGVTLNASRVRAGGEPRLLEFKTAVRVMAITTAHDAFQNFVMEGRIKCRLDLAVATQAKLRVVHRQHFDG